MIDARELRIGNIVEPITMSPIMVTGITQQKTLDGIFTLIFVDYGESFLQEHLNPIPLTEEWLIKLGFEKDVDFEQQIEADYTREILMVNVRNGVYYIMFNGLKIEIRYVHSLQNMYFCLLNKELCVDTKIQTT